MKPIFLSKRQKTRRAIRRTHGNPWDSPSLSSPRKSSKRVTFRNPIVRSKSSKSSSHAAWRSVSSKK
jgi:hypothetical protein